LMRHPAALFKKRLLYASPWIFAGAAALLVTMVVLFAANNLAREKRLIYDHLYNKAQAVIRFVGASTRASMMMARPGPEQVQQLLEQAVTDSEILYIAVVDETGKVLAHSDPSLVGTQLDHGLLKVDQLPPTGSYQVFDRQGIKVYELASPFSPFKGRRGFFRRRMEEMMGSLPPGDRPFRQWCFPEQQVPGGNRRGQGRETFILVGLDMSPEAQVIRQDLVHMGIMSMAVLVVSLGGVVALLIAQGYRASERTLQYMEAFTAQVVSRLPVGIIATDRDGLIQSINQAAAAIIGVSAAQAIHRRPETVLPQEIARFFTETEEEKQIIGQDLLFTAEHGDQYHLQISSIPMQDEQGGHIGRVVLLLDLTRTKELEAEIRKHDRLVSLGKMAAGVAHEVRNPLSSIKGLATLLGKKFPETSSERQAARLLTEEVERLNRAITELLTYARPLPLELVPTDPRALIHDSVALVRSDAQAQGVTIEVACSEGLGEIAIDPDRFRQVLLNLFLNSLQAMPNGGRLVVRCATEGNVIKMEFIDTGPGIAPEDLPRVMDPYFTTKADGTGLGLAMVQKIVEEHGGKVELASEPGRGTTVTITLPRSQQPVSQRI